MKSFAQTGIQPNGELSVNVLLEVQMVQTFTDPLQDFCFSETKAVCVSTVSQCCPFNIQWINGSEQHDTTLDLSLTTGHAMAYQERRMHAILSNGAVQ